ncbi:MAG: succinylglutamate desuccinylase [Waddliaceae bacterium]|nr:succinylglutamate desuccinylase [Waddliaceae bacterium]
MVDKQILEIGSERISRGQKRTIVIKLPNLYDCTPVNMPVHVIRGKKEGPVLLVTGVIHGDELNGMEIIRKLLSRPLSNLSGTIIAVPVVNVYGYLFQSRYLVDRRDLNRSFPGSEKGSLASRLAHIVDTQLLAQADYLIDLHSGSQHRSNLPQIRVNGDTQEERDLAMIFNAPVVLQAKERDNSLRSMAFSRKIPCLLYEAGEALRIDAPSIRVGLRGILNVMEALKMLSPKKPRDLLEKSRSSFTCSSYWIRASRSGVFRPKKALGQRVRRKESLFDIGSPFSSDSDTIKAPMEGIIIGINKHPLVHEGAALFNVACFEELKDVEEEIRSYQEGHQGSEYIELKANLEIY